MAERAIRTVFTPPTTKNARDKITKYRTPRIQLIRAQKPAVSARDENWSHLDRRCHPLPAQQREAPDIREPALPETPFAQHALLLKAELLQHAHRGRVVQIGYGADAVYPQFGEGVGNHGPGRLGDDPLVPKLPGPGRSPAPLKNFARASPLRRCQSAVTNRAAGRPSGRRTPSRTRFGIAGSPRAPAPRQSR